MPEFRFIHCSDLHIDSPFKGLSVAQPALAERLRQSTYQAFQNIVQLAIRERVDAVLVSGDIYDSCDKSLQAQLKFRRALKQLSDANIPSFVIHGNHDPLDSWSASLDYPEGVTVFSGEKVEFYPLIRNDKVLAHIYGISYPKREVTENLSLKFKRQNKETFAVGMLHANVGGNPGHDNYAPCSVDDLVSGKMDYWALGHIHAREVLRNSDPAIVYPGNTQARKMKEAGEKGCYLVTLRLEQAPEIQFIPTDEVRFYSEDLDLSLCSTLEEVIRSVRSRCEGLSRQASGKDVLIRLLLKGKTSVHQELQRPGSLEELGEEVRHFFEDHDQRLWIDLDLNTEGSYDIDSLRQGNDFISDVISFYDEAESGPDAGSNRKRLKDVFENWQGQKYLQDLNDEEVRKILNQARTLTLDYLVHFNE